MEVKCLSLMMHKIVYEFNLSCNWSIIDGACDDPITTSDEGKDILSSNRVSNCNS